MLQSLLFGCQGALGRLETANDPPRRERRSQGGFEGRAGFDLRGVGPSVGPERSGAGRELTHQVRGDRFVL